MPLVTSLPYPQLYPQVTHVIYAYSSSVRVNPVIIDELDQECPDIAMPTYQTGRMLVLNAGERQSGNMICANSKDSDECDILQLDAAGMMHGKTFSVDQMQINSNIISSALLTLTASAESTQDLICVNSPGRTDCNLFKLTSVGLLSLSGKVVADGGFTSINGDIATVKGSVISGGPLIGQDTLTVQSDSVLSGALQVTGESSLQTLAVTTLSVAENATLAFASLTANSASIDTLSVNTYLALSGPLSLSENLTITSLTVTDSITVVGDANLNTLTSSGLITADGGLLSSANVSIINNSSLVIAGLLSVIDVDVKGLLTASNLNLGQALTLNSLNVANITADNLMVSGTIEAGVLEVVTLEVLSTAMISGALDVMGDTQLENLVVNASAIVSSTITALNMNVTDMITRRLGVEEEVRIAGSLECGYINAVNVTLSESLSVSGQTTLNDVEVSGFLALAQGFDSLGDVTLLNDSSLIAAGGVWTSSLNVSGPTTLGFLDVEQIITVPFLNASSVESIDLRVSGLSTLGLVTTDSLLVGGNTSIIGSLNVMDTFTARLVLAEESIVQTSRQVHNMSAMYLTVEYLEVSQEARMNTLTANKSDVVDLLVTGDLIVEGLSSFGVVNTTGALSVDADLSVSGELQTAGIMSSGNVTFEADIVIKGQVSAFSGIIQSYLSSATITAFEVSTGNLSVTESTQLAELVTTGQIVALQGLTSPRDIITTDDGIIATTGEGEIISRGLITGVGGITSPAFISTSENGTIFSAGSFTANSTATITGNMTVHGHTALRRPVIANSLVVNSTLNVVGLTTTDGLMSSGLIAGNAGVAATSLISANLTLNSLLVTGLIHASRLSVDTAIWTPAIRYYVQPLLFSGYTDIATGTGEACSVLC
jgi:cytoskeletal protein CcmA (bactofilin family)